MKQQDLAGKMKQYDVIIVGAGASGLMCAAQLDLNNAAELNGALKTGRAKGLILEAGPEAGRKILAAGGGRCNFTHGGNIKDYITKYGDKGGKIRSVLFKFNNQKTVEFFRELGVDSFEQEDGRVFPKSEKAADIRDALLQACRRNGWEIVADYKVKKIVIEEKAGEEAAEEENNRAETVGQKTPESPDCNHIANLRFALNDEYVCKDLVIATGGRSCPKLGGDAEMYRIVNGLGLELAKQSAALSPVFVENYPFGKLSGMTLKDITAKVIKNGKAVAEQTGDLLLTHRGFSGPVVLDLSRNAAAGCELELTFYQGDHVRCRGVKRSLSRYLSEEIGLPERLISTVAELAGQDPDQKAASVNGGMVKEIFDTLRNMRFHISGKAGYDKAMVTAGGVSLKEIDIKTCESKKHPGLFLVGEILDVDGDTGGYNLQFAFSTGAAAAREISQRMETR